MAEKTGNLIKLTYEFNSGWCCEVSFDGERWARVTAREFRSFNGKRRILNVENPNEPYYEEYNGPIYFYGTNRISKTSRKVGMVFVDDKDPRDAKRPRTQAGF
jgi:hypothetical protein